MRDGGNLGNSGGFQLAGRVFFFPSTSWRQSDTCLQKENTSRCSRNKHDAAAKRCFFILKSFFLDV